VKNVLVLIGKRLDVAAIQSAGETLRAGGASVGDAVWLSPGTACDLPFDPPTAGEPAKPVELPGVDAVALPADNRRKKLLVADMESTIIENEMLDELADFLGLRDRISAITARAMNGEIGFEGALQERVGLLKGLAVGKLHEAARRIRYTAGAGALVATMRNHGARCALVSGGFTHFTDLVQRELGFDLAAANRLEHDGATLAGTVAMPILGKEAKLATLDRLCAEQGIARSDAVAVGDGANDLPMLKAAGLGVAYRAKPAVAAEVEARIHHGDLTALLYLQGYRRSEIVEAT
jgi:phosphoserine phosphatase